MNIDELIELYKKTITDNPKYDNFDIKDKIEIFKIINYIKLDLRTVNGKKFLNAVKEKK